MYYFSNAQVTNLKLQANDPAYSTLPTPSGGALY